MSRLIVGPFNRVEGDLEVRLDIDGGRVRAAEVVSPMYRGFEPMLVGRDPMDALVIVPRICGICSVSQSVAAARAPSCSRASTGVTPCAGTAPARSWPSTPSTPSTTGPTPPPSPVDTVG